MSANLLCYFTDTTSGQQFRLSVFSNKECRLASGGSAVDQEPLGRVFRIITKQGKKGF